MSHDILSKLDDIEQCLDHMTAAGTSMHGLGYRLLQTCGDHDEVMAHLQAQLMTAKRVVRELEREIERANQRRVAA